MGIGVELGGGGEDGADGEVGDGLGMAAASWVSLWVEKPRRDWGLGCGGRGWEGDRPGRGGVRRRGGRRCRRDR